MFRVAPTTYGWVAGWYRGVFGVVLLAPCFFIGCASEDSLIASSGPAIVSDVAGVFCSIDNVACEQTVDIAFHIVGVDSVADSTFVIRVDRFDDDVLDENLVVQDVMSGTFPDYVVRHTLPLGRHKLQISFEYGMGENHTGTVPFRIADCRAPEPICINGLAVELMPQPPGTDADGDGDIDAAAMTVYASDFVASPVADCSLPVVYSINRPGQTPDKNQASLVVTCDDPSTVVVEIHAWDNADNPSARQPDGSIGGPNQDFCGSYILVQDNQQACN